MSLAPQSRRADSRRNRQRIIDVAEVIFKRDGAAASLEEIARNAGVGSATLHRHFPSRHALLNAVFHEGVQRLCTRARQLSGEAGPQLALVRWLGELTVYSSTTRGLAMALLTVADDPIADEDTCHGMVLDAAAFLLEQAAQAGTLRSDVLAKDLITLANAISQASESKPDDAIRLLNLALGGVLAEMPRPEPAGAMGRRAQ